MMGRERLRGFSHPCILHGEVKRCVRSRSVCRLEYTDRVLRGLNHLEYIIVRSTKTTARAYHPCGVALRLGAM